MKLQLFSSFSNLFHKRSQSDSALSSRLQAVIEPAPRSVSLSAFEGLVLPVDDRNPFAAELARDESARTLAIAPPPLTANSSSSAVVSTTSSSVSQISTSHISAASHGVVIEVLTRRIQELEELSRLRGDRSAAASFLALETSLQRSRSTCTEVLRQNDTLSTQVAELRSHLDRTTSELQSLQTKNSRLQAILDLPILIGVFRRVAFGESAEDALIDAVKNAVGQPGSSWKRLLEPVVGPRSPEDYIAQVDCTLKARRETRDWKKKARFWKVRAKEDGRHVDTVTPSVSLLSEVCEQVDATTRRQREDTGAADHAADAGAPAGRIPPGSMRVDQRPAEIDEKVDSSHQQAQSQTMVAASASKKSIYAGSQLSENPSAGVIAPQTEFAPQLGRCDSTSASDSTTCNGYGNLPPLASVTFRQSYSIRSLSSPSKKEILFGSSSSISNLRRRSAKFSATTSVRFSVLQDVPEPLTSDAPSSSSGSIYETVRPATPIPLPPSTPPPSESTSGEFSFGSWEHLSHFINSSFSFNIKTSPSNLASSVTAKTETQHVSTQPSAQSASKDICEDRDDKAQERTTGIKPERAPGSADTTPTPSPGSTPTSSPVKKSRLPLPTALRKKSRKPSISVTASATAKFIKRLSQTISRPVLMDTTNAAAAVDARLAAAAKVKVTASARNKATTNAGGVGTADGTKTKEAMPPVKRKAVPRRVSPATSPTKASK